MIDERTEQALSMYALGCIDDEELEYLIGRDSSSFTDEERNKFTELLNSGFIDTFRKLHADTVQYSCWSYLKNARKNNSGYRADYFVVNTALFDKVQKSEILGDIIGSDHCPIKLELSFD